MSSPPVANPVTAAVSEDGTLTLSGDVLSTDTDPAGLALSVVSVDGEAITNTTTIVGAYGTLVIAPNGDYTYTLNNASSGVLGLNAGQVAPDLFNYVVSDRHTYTSTTTGALQNLLTQSEAFNTWGTFGTTPVVTTNIAAGPNGGAASADKFVLSAASSGLYTNTNVSGQYTFGVWVLAVSGSTAFSLNHYSGLTGAVDLETITATGTWQRVSLTFTGDGNANSNVALMLGPSQTTAGTFEFWGAQVNAGATPGLYAPTTGSIVNTTTTVSSALALASSLTVDVTGNAAAPTAVPDTAAVKEDTTLTATGNVLTNDTGPSLAVISINGTVSSGATTVIGTYGTLAIQANGAYTYTLGNSQSNVRALTNGQVVSDVFDYAISDGVTLPTPPSSTLTVNVTGSTPVAQPDSASVSAAGTQTASGNLLSNDTATAAGPLTLAAVNGITISGGATTITGTYGTLVVQSNGTYTYTLNTNSAVVMALLAGESASDAFTYTVSDGAIYDSASPPRISLLIRMQSPTRCGSSSAAFRSPPMVPRGRPGRRRTPSRWCCRRPIRVSLTRQTSPAITWSASG